MTDKKYIDYFDIDPRYYAAVTPELIQSEKVSWKKFYPHPAFIELLSKIHASISRRSPKSLWLEGAYGSGKSHAVLTVKSLFEAPDEEVEEYFRKYNLNPELLQIFLTDKNAGKIIVVHKIGSSSIHSDQDLILSVQLSIMNALETHGAKNKGENSLKESVLKWLEQKANHDYLGQLITEKEYFWDFYGKSIDEIIAILKSESHENTTQILSSLIKAASDHGVFAFRMDIHDLMNWIRNIIDANNLNAILFIWDEFTEFFNNNPTSLTGFQSLAELSSSSPFYFLIVAHDTGGLFLNIDSAKKILDRFLPPIKIDLPDNMAFKLMAQAMQLSDDTQLKTEWEKHRQELNDNFAEARAKICSSIEHVNSNRFILDNDIQAVVPIHPYAALMLKYLSVIFGSNQRSMFDFIISDESELHAFKWYIKNFGPHDTNHAFTADMLWDFFNGRSNHSIKEDGRLILNAYNILKPEALQPEEQRVLKTILLLQAFNSQNSNINLLRPNDNNINLAFSGLGWPEGAGSSIASKLVDKGLIFKRALSNGSFEYTIAGTMDDVSSIRQEKEELTQTTNTQTLIDKANLADAIFIPEEISDRFLLRASPVHDLQRTISEINRHSTHEHFYLIALFALNETEATIIQNCLPSIAQSSNIFFIDTSLNPLGKSDLERYINASAYSRYYMQKGDRQRSTEFQSKAQEYISNWKAKISNGPFILYSQNEPLGKRLPDIQSLVQELKAIDYNVYPCGLEHYKATASIFSSKSRQFKLGAKCGITQKLTGQFSAPREDNSLDSALAGAWEINDYWENPKNPNLPIVRAKLKVESIISQNLELPSRSVSVLTIYNELKKPPFGFMANNFTAFVLGFLLKEYANENFFWSNDRKTEIMNPDKLAEMIFNTLNYDLNPSKNFREEFITLISQEQKAFFHCSSEAFDLTPDQCTSIDAVKEKISTALLDLELPAWFVKYILPELNTKSDAQVLAKLIDAYSRISTDDEAVIKIGKLAQSDPNLASDLRAILTEENCRKGLMRYIENFRNGALPKIAAQINDNGEYITQFLNCASQLSSPEKLDEKLNALIPNYEIVNESNKYLPKSSSFSETIASWIAMTKSLRLPLEAIKDYASGFMPLLETLYEMNRLNELPPSKRPKFLEALRLYGEDFVTLCRNQHEAFQIVAAKSIEGLSEPEIKELFEALPTNQFTRTASEYFRCVEAEVKKYKTGILREKLQAIWQQKTNTKSPEDWSSRFDTPILCMFNEKEREDAKHAFGILMKNSPTEAEANFAISFLEAADFYDTLNSPEARDEFFALRFLRDFRYVLPDLQAVREALKNTSKESPFFWMENAAIQKQVKSLAEKNYRLNFQRQVFDLIDEMPPSSLRIYIKDLISGNLNVGIEILKQQEVNL